MAYEVIKIVRGDKLTRRVCPFGTRPAAEGLARAFNLNGGPVVGWVWFEVGTKIDGTFWCVAEVEDRNEYGEVAP